VLWRTELPEGRLGSPVVLSNDRDSVYAHSGDGALVAYSAADGAVRWSAPLGYRPDTPPALLPDGTLVSGGRTTTVWRGTDDEHDADAGPAPVVAVRGADGRGEEVWRRDDLRLHEVTVPAATGPMSGLSVDSDGRIAVSTAMGAVYVYG
jgi:outer membrane protein assembly factor BamB